MNDKDKHPQHKFLMMVRQGLLLINNAIEMELNIKPRTSQLRDFWRGWKSESYKASEKKGAD